MHEHSRIEKDFKCHSPYESVDGEYCTFEQRRLVISMIITGLTMVIELVGGLLSGSLALLSDAGHMFSHLFALGISYIAILLACRPPTESQSFGFYRTEILAALANGFTLLLITAWIVYEAWQRLKNPVHIAGVEMFIVAAIGLAVNAVTAVLLKDASHRDINIRGAFVHVLGDLGSSVGVVLAAVTVWLTGWTAIDAIVSVLIAIVILYWSLKLLWDAARILLQSTPKHLRHDEIEMALKNEITEIKSVHHIHVWELTSHMYIMTAHIEVNDMSLSNVDSLRKHAQNILAEKFGIRHADLQFETP